MSRLNVRGWRFVLPLAALALGTSLLATSALGASSGVVRVAVMTDCKGAFGGAYEVGAAGANIALAQFAGGKVKNNKKPSAGITGAKAGGKTIQVVGYGCGDDTPATALKETRRLMQQAQGRRHGRPAVGRRGGRDRELGEAAPDEDGHHRHRRVAGPDAADRAEERVPLPRRRRPVERRHRRDRLQEARLAEGRDHHGRLQLRLDVRGRHHRRLLRDRRRDHEARVPAAEHDRLLVLRPAAAAAEPGGRVLLGRRRHRHRAGAQGVRAGVRHDQAGAALGQPVPLVPDGLPGRRAAPHRLVRRGLRHRAGPEAPRR